MLQVPAAGEQGVQVHLVIAKPGALMEQLQRKASPSFQLGLSETPEILLGAGLHPAQ